MNKQNGANPVIDAFLTRMSELDRYSDDDTVIQNNQLLPLDVVIGKNGKSGIVIEVCKTAGFWRCQIIGQCQCILDATHTHTIRTINELEAVAARSELTKLWGQ